jgi:putative acetyltransferase
MSLIVRPIHHDEARRFLEVHRASIRNIAARDYPASVIDSWAPLPITQETVNAFLQNPDNEIRLIAEIDGKPAGIGAVVIAKSELRACYVAPEFSRQGIGSALVAEIEDIAREHGLSVLQLESSVTAEPFYVAHGYEVIERGEHMLSSGVRMAAVKMQKRLDGGA